MANYALLRAALCVSQLIIIIHFDFSLSQWINLPEWSGTSNGCRRTKGSRRTTNGWPFWSNPKFYGQKSNAKFKVIFLGSFSLCSAFTELYYGERFRILDQSSLVFSLSHSLSLIWLPINLINLIYRMERVARNCWMVERLPDSLINSTHIFAPVFETKFSRTTKTNKGKLKLFIAKV